MTLPANMDAPTRLSTDFIFVYIRPFNDDTPADVTPAEWGKPVPNVVGHSSSEDATDEEWRHYGTGVQTELDIIEYPVSMSLEASAHLFELGAFLGFPPDAVRVSLKDATQLPVSNGKVHIAQVGFTADGVVVETEYWAEVSWTSLASSGSAGTSATYKSYELSGKAKDKYITDGSETYNPVYVAP